MTLDCDFELRFRFGSRVRETAGLCRGLNQVAHDLETVTSIFVLGLEAWYMKRRG